MLSDDDSNWDKVYSVDLNLSEVSFIRLPEADARYLKINFLKNNNNMGVGISEITFLDLNDATTKIIFLITLLKIPTEETTQSTLLMKLHTGL